MVEKGSKKAMAKSFVSTCISVLLWFTLVYFGLKHERNAIECIIKEILNECYNKESLAGDVVSW